ncbi:hypothetical protein B1H18_01505 [Streptomyces tsukubensis]|uniref:Sulfotransferase family protein n=2 Tax=Streptomyces tsukubensis TaxID=83656 RepID=A0A1V4AH21_9ACTN|nr:hypothetical protein B1H18_01505 [Streptomyces tsukubensis]
MDQDRLGVLVVGMHRSGTSAVTRAVNLLGVPLGLSSDRLPASPSNKPGHWESTSLVALNDSVLHALGRSSWCPPPLDIWAGGPRAAAGPTPRRARLLLQRVHPTRQWVWKDPRTSLTLPFWLAALHDVPVAIVLAVRHPMEVAVSLHKRDGTPVEVGLCMWERYVRHALAAAAGLPVLITHYDRLLADPVAWAQRAAGFLTPLGARITWQPGWENGLRSFIQPGLRHEIAPRADRAEAATAHLDTVHDALRQYDGPVRSFRPPDLPPEDPRVEQRLLHHARGGRPQSIPGRAPGTAR